MNFISASSIKKAESAGIFVFEGEANPRPKFFTGKKNEVYAYDEAGQRIFLVGLGARADFTADQTRLAAYRLLKAAAKAKLTATAAALPAAFELAAFIEGCYLADYQFAGLHKKKTGASVPDSPVRIKTVYLQGRYPRLNKLAARIKVIFAAVNRAKDLVNLPANVVTPAYLARVAAHIAQKPKVKLSTFNFAQAKKAGLTAFCAVAQGSAEPARFIVLEYLHGGNKPKIALVGKGLTFDSGGISLKPAAGMGEMKTDMAGAAVALTAFAALVELQVKQNLLCVAPATENMPGGAAYKPGDIITTADGLTVEINSTDAEGRLLLCDALWYAQKLGAKRIIDYATLTGACQIALGETRAGVLTNAPGFLAEYLAAAERSGEKHWQLPLDEEYAEYLKSRTADTLNNSKDRLAGTITAAKFLEKFIQQGVEWIHCDIAGTAFLQKQQRYLEPQATGFGVRTLLDLLGGHK
ncbi:MAG: leucyl aminopeptidase [Candidatus Margulisbacteria bacterium]|jgi:leucyl aminopeptidase|nr:leucyl aminopeptidase [Candidatus Margulisiibacteriota bacterium]